MNKLVCPNCGNKKSLFFNAGPNPLPETIQYHCHELVGGCGWIGPKSELVEPVKAVYNIVDNKCVLRQE